LALIIVIGEASALMLVRKAGMRCGGKHVSRDR
jgi:hypothetical protein